MSNDYIKKEPTKTEKMLYELAMRQQSLENQTFSNSMTILALAVSMGTDAEKIAKLLASEDQKVKDFGKQINDAIDKIKGPREEKEHNHGEKTE